MMAKYCTQCGKETGVGRFCIHCGAPVTGAPTSGKEDGAAQALPPGESGGESGIPQNLPPAAAGGGTPKKKRGGLSVLAFAVGGLLLVALIVVGVVLLFQAFNQPVQITAAFTTTDPVEGSPTSMDFYTPVTDVINLYGEADNLTEDTVIDLLWVDVTNDRADIIGEAVATVDADRGVFYSQFQMPAEASTRLVPSGDYRVEVTLDGADAPSQMVMFSVYTVPPPETVAYPFNDAYMVLTQPGGSCLPVTKYPEGTADMTMIVSLAEIDASTDFSVRWLHQTDGEWQEIEGDVSGLQSITGEPAPGLYACSISADSWPPGQYRAEVYPSGSAEIPSAAVEYIVLGEETVSPVLQELVMTTDLDENGAPVDEVTEYPFGTQTFVCSFYFQGGGETPVDWEWHDRDGMIGERQHETLPEEGYYWVSYDHPYGLSFAPGDYTLLFYLPDQGEEPVAEISFSVVETSSMAMADLDEGSMPLTEDAWADWNDWLMTFTEGRLTPFSEDLPADSDLIDFGVLYNYFYNENMYATLDEYGMCWLNESALDYTLWWFFDAEVTHASTDQAMYEGGSYGYKVPEEQMPYVFPQVRGIYAHDEEGFIFEFDVYTAPVGFADFNEDYDSWEAGDTMPEYLGEMHAWVRWVTEDDTGRRVLTSYEWIE